jgi:hypothetical protein
MQSDRGRENYRHTDLLVDRQRNVQAGCNAAEMKVLKCRNAKGSAYIVDKVLYGDRQTYLLAGRESCSGGAFAQR